MSIIFSLLWRWIYTSRLFPSPPLSYVSYEIEREREEEKGSFLIEDRERES